MIDKVIRSLVLLIAVVGLSRTDVFAAEPLPPRALARLGDHRFYHGPEIDCAVLSPDGRLVASAAYSYYYVHAKDRIAYNRVVFLWDAATGERLRELQVPHSSIHHLAFSPDGKRLAVDYRISDKDSGVAVFDSESGGLSRRIEAFTSWVSMLRFSADGKQLLVSECQGPVSAWDAATGNRLRLWKPPSDEEKNSVKGMRGMLSPDGKVVVWEMAYPRSMNDLLNWYPVSIRVHDATTNKLLYQKEFAHRCPCPLGDFTFSSDSKWFTAMCHPHQLNVWETATGNERVVRDVPTMIDFALKPDGRHAVLFEGGSRVRMWDLETGKPSLDFYAGFVSLQYALLRTPQVFSADGKTLLLATHSTLRLFDAATGKERGKFGHRAAVMPRFSADGRTLFTSCGERKCRWDVSRPQEPVLLRHEPRKDWEVGYLACNADERFFLKRFNSHIYVRESATGHTRCALADYDGGVYNGRFSPHADRILLKHSASVSSPGEKPDLLRLYDATTGKVVSEITPGNQVGSSVFSPNGRLIARTDGAGLIHLHDAATGKLLRTLHSAQPLPQAEFDHADLLFSPDSECLIEGFPTLLMRIFRVSSSREIIRFHANLERMTQADRLSCMACSPDNRLLAVAEEGSGTIYLLEIASGKVRVEFAGHRHGVHGLAFAPDGKTLASGGEDNVVFLWDVTGARTPAVGNKANDLATWWRDLASEDGRQAGNAIAGLLRKPEASVAFLKERLRPAEPTDEKRLVQLLADLDADSYETREEASREFTRLGERAEAILRQALTNRPSLEVRRRIEEVLNKLEPSPPPPEILRTLRAIEVLEHAGTPASRQCLEVLAKGAAEARPTREAKKSWERLTKRR